MGSKAVRLLIVALIAVGVLIPTVLVLTQEKASAASMVLSIIDGTADVARGSAFARAGDGHVLLAGDRVRTSDQGHAVVTFFDGSTIEIEPATTITVVEAAATVAGAITIQLEQAIGRTWASVRSLTHADSKFEIKTPTTTATVRGTGFVTDVLASGATTVTATDGIVAVSAQGQTVVVPAGSLTTVQPSGPPTPPLPAPKPDNTLRFGLHSPALLVVVDPVGRSCGIVAAGPTLVRQIPGCLATEPGVDPQLIDVPKAMAGTYSIGIESVAPGGDFVATASALDASGGLSFNYALSGGGVAGTKFGASLKVESGPNGTLRASGLSKLSLVDRTPTHVVVLPTSPRPTQTGTPNPAVFALLPRFGFTAGVEVTPPPPGQSSTPTTAAPSPSASPTPTEVVAFEPTPVPTVAPVRTFAPPPLPTLPPAPTPTLIPPTPIPTAAPSPTPSGPTLIGGVTLPGSVMTVTGHGWSTALVTISWEDGRPLVQVNADAAGDFAVAVAMPFDASVGTTHRITASDSRLSASGQVGVYTPAITVTCSSAGALASIAGSGWPPSARYAIRSSLLPTPLSGTTAADGMFSTSFTPQVGVLPGEYQFNANSGSLLAEPQTCTLR
jgi:hypothetical protein